MIQDALPVLLCSVSCSFCSEVADDKTFKHNKLYKSIIEESIKTPNHPKELIENLKSNNGHSSIGGEIVI